MLFLSLSLSSFGVGVGSMDNHHRSSSNSSSEVPVEREVEIVGEDGNGGNSAVTREAKGGSTDKHSPTSSGLFCFHDLRLLLQVLSFVTDKYRLGR